MSAAQQSPMEVSSKFPLPCRIISRTSARGAREWAKPLMVRCAPSGTRVAASVKLMSFCPCNTCVSFDLSGVAVGLPRRAVTRTCSVTE